MLVVHAGPFQQDDATHAAHASHGSSHVHSVLLPPGGSSGGRPIGAGARFAAGGTKGASSSSGKVLVNEKVVQLAKQLTDAGVPLEIATARAEVQVCGCSRPQQLDLESVRFVRGPERWHRHKPCGGIWLEKRCLACPFERWWHAVQPAPHVPALRFRLTELQDDLSSLGLHCLTD